MENLVILEDKQALTTSLKVAEVFGKQHKHVVRDIRNLIQEIADIKDAPKFGLISYVDSAGREQTAYLMDKNAFTLLVMGYTGAKALQFKLDYIKAFDAMEAYIRQTQGKTLSEGEAAMLHQLLNFYRFLDNCKKTEEQHKRRFIATKGKNKSKDERIGLAQEFYTMRNFLLEIGNAKELEARYKRYCLKNPQAVYHPKASKFVMLFTIDKYEVVRGAIFDFLKLEWHTDEYSLHFSKQAKNVAQKTNLELLHKNETNLFQEEETDLIDMSKLHLLASKLLILDE